MSLLIDTDEKRRTGGRGTKGSDSPGGGLVGFIRGSAGFFSLLALLAAGTALLMVALDRDSAVQNAASSVAGSPPAHDTGGSATEVVAGSVRAEKYTAPDPTLPAPPPGAVKKFDVDVYEHITRVAKDKPPTRVWSYGVNGKLYKGTGVSPPMVVTEGDTVEIKLHNGSTEAMGVTFPHSIDFHSSEVAPNVNFKDIAPGKSFTFKFVAKHPGVFMYHCATKPVLMHTGAGMVGMMVVKPKNLAPVDKELWITQQEFYIGQPGKNGDFAKMQAKDPSVIAFNGYANQYADHPITVKKGERIRMYVMNAGPSIWSAFHVIGTVFDKTVVEGTNGHDSQTMNLAPSQGGWAEFTLDEEGTYPFVTHGFGDMAKGALGVLATEYAKVAKTGGH